MRLSTSSPSTPTDNPKRSTRRNALKLSTLALGAPLALSACVPFGAKMVASDKPPTAVTEGQSLASAGVAVESGAAELTGPTVAQAAELPAPATVLTRAIGRLLDGDYLNAIQDFVSIQATYPGSDEAAEAALRQAEASLSDDRFAAAEAQLTHFLSAFTNHPKRPVATLMLGRAFEGQGDGGAAVDAYLRYESLAAPEASLADFVHLRAAQVYFNAGRTSDGWAELTQASAAVAKSPSFTMQGAIHDELALRYWNSGDKARTVEERKAALEAAVQAHKLPAQQATTAWRLVAAADAASQTALADSVRRRIISDWPHTSTALQALNELGADGVPLFLKGTIYFSNSRWRQTNEALTQYINLGAPEGNLDTARYYRAVALTRLGDDGALAALDRVVQQHSDSQWAPDALWEAAQLLLRRGDRPAAAARFEQLAVNYPQSEHQGNALYWLGKLLPDLGNATAGQRYMAAAAEAGHEDFYTFRARAALRQPSPAAKPLEEQAGISASDREAWNTWLAAHNVPADQQAAKRKQVEDDGRFKRATALLEAGFRSEAQDEFLEIARTNDYDPVVVAHVALQARDRGFFPLSVTLGHNLEDTVAGMGEPSLLRGPRLVQKLTFPLAFVRLVEPAAKAQGLDPLLLLGLMKQESWFEPRSRSSANARGLTQFIPETAKSVAQELNWPNWTWDDMNRPYVSVPFGARYLSDLIKEFRGNPYFAVAAYNSGPGNILRWAGGDRNVDIDQFVANISYSETRNYVTSVTGNYELYKAIYYR